MFGALWQRRARRQGRAHSSARDTAGQISSDGHLHRGTMKSLRLVLVLALFPATASLHSAEKSGLRAVAVAAYRRPRGVWHPVRDVRRDGARLENAQPFSADDGHRPRKWTSRLPAHAGAARARRLRDVARHECRVGGHVRDPHEEPAGDARRTEEGGVRRCARMEPGCHRPVFEPWGEGTPAPGMTLRFGSIFRQAAIRRGAISA